jgi:hypothetical protein
MLRKAKSIFSRGINPKRRGRIDCTSHTFASLLDSSMAKAKRKVETKENMRTFFLDFFNHRKLIIDGGTRTINIENK